MYVSMCPHRDRVLTCTTRAGAFQLYDINNDGLITYDEMLKIVQSIYDMTGAMVKLPPDEDTAAKVRARPSSPPHIRIDHKADNGVSAESGQDLCAHGPQPRPPADV